MLAFVNVPAVQSSHVRSLVAVPAASTRRPGKHVDHVVHEAALAARLYPPTHAAHVRSAVALPASVTYCPAAHCVFIAQGVEASPSASHVSSPHTCFAASPPAQ